ncbi:MAG: pyruvate dehydrogenase (acetyl-transferring) E1 component subunit alpha [Spirochaetaceae bacterium]
MASKSKNDNSKSDAVNSESKKLGSYEKDFLNDALERMLLIRRFEEKSAQMYGLRKIGGFCHLYNGQEAVAVAAAMASDLSRDYMLTAYRDHGHALACGMDPKVIMAELYGKITGCSRGKGGSMHMFDVEKHMLGGNGIVGAQIPIATGVAFAEMYKKKVLQRDDSGVALCFFGDGAVHQGAFHESLNLAGVWKLPAVYMIENNRFGMGSAVHRVSAVEDFEIKAVGYNMDGMKIDGMSFVECYQGIGKAIERARTDSVPTLIDIKTYRYKGHSMSDPAKYRTKDELEKFKAQDPIELLKASMKEADMLTDEEYQSLDKRLREQVQEAVDFAENSDEPALETIYEDIYA